MTHYVVLLEWAEDDADGVDTIGVAHSFDEAKEMFNAQRIAEREYAREQHYEIFNDLEDLFDTGESGYYTARHITLYIHGVE